MKKRIWLIAAILALGVLMVPRVRADSTVIKQPDGVILQTDQGVLRLSVFGDQMIRVTFAPGKTLPARESLCVIAKPVIAGWSLKESADSIEVQTDAIHALIDRKSGAVGFYDRKDQPILKEADGGRRFGATTFKGATGTGAGQSFIISADEAIFGLGQHPTGTWNYRGTTVHLQQKNMDIAVPVLLSTKGYGILWDNPAITDVKISPAGTPGAVDWDSESGEAVDYYFMYGPTPDEIIHRYRQLTGAAPLFGKWVYGFWQSRERYKTQEELLGVAREYRKQGIPIDGMVQDWQYWSPKPWGSHEFGPNFPDAKGMMDELHAAHLHAIISVWAKFDKGSANYDALDHAGFLYEPVYKSVYPPGLNRWYDAFNPEARKMYWRQMSDDIFTRGFDGWWLDATEPELGGKWGEIRDLKTAAGPGYTVANAYPLMTTAGVYQGQRAETDDKRVFILTRSAWAGQQRNAAVSWSGDIQGNWATFKKQIPDGLNFVSSGIPYWNTDIGGFFSGSNADEAYRELFARWFQYGSFCPLFRSHGTNTQKEMWSFGPAIQPILVKYDRLRYRLMPYIYSTAWKVTSEDYTMMRPLMMDFTDDSKALAVSDQFMFGPALMACPVTEPAIGLSVIPSTSLADRDGHPGGLSATYYQGENFEEKKLERIDPIVSFNWDHVKREGVGENLQHDPIPGISMDHFSARWEGFLITRAAGDYHLQMKADDGMRLWVDGKLVIEDWASRKLATHSIDLKLPADSKVPIKVEYYQNLHDAIVELRWQPPGDGTVYTRPVYLPAGLWTDFWTGKSVDGGQNIQAEAPLEKMPLFVKPGSIIPMGPNVQYAMEKSDPIEIRVYRGADGTFTLYEDQGDTYQYEKKVYATIPISWDDKAGTLTIGNREGAFPGMQQQHTFKIVYVTDGHGGGVDETDKPDQTCTYTGQQMVLKADH